MIVQIPLSDWPESLNEHYALLDVVPESINSELITFSRSYDNLDSFDGAVLLMDNYMVALMYYINAPIKGLSLVVKSDISKCEKEKILSNVIKLLDLSEGNLIWRAE